MGCRWRWGFLTGGQRPGWEEVGCGWEDSLRASVFWSRSQRRLRILNLIQVLQLVLKVNLSPQEGRTVSQLDTPCLIIFRLMECCSLFPLLPKVPHVREAPGGSYVSGLRPLDLMN